ncbi:MAG: ureidoglycolate lyase [Pseudomonadota bacterium]
MLDAPPLTGAAFAPFGEVVAVGGDSREINAGLCHRFHDLARFDIVDGRAGLSLFQAQIRPLPHICDLVERHPLGSQCFVPMGGSRYLVIAAEDQGGAPGPLHAWTAAPTQAVNIHRNTWHGVLAPISGTGLFAVIDRIGEGANLEEFTLPDPVAVSPAI